MMILKVLLFVEMALESPIYSLQMIMCFFAVLRKLNVIESWRPWLSMREV